MPQSEGLLASGTVRLFGREYTGLTVNHVAGTPGTTNPLAAAIANAPGKTLARVYGFSYLGNYFKLAEPVVLLVLNAGELIDAAPDKRLTIDFVGAEEGVIGFSGDVKMWTVDQLDMTVRIDVKIGWVKDLLLADGLDSANNVTTDGAVRRADTLGDAVQKAGHLIGRAGHLVGG